MPKRVEIDDELHDLAQANCPKYLSTTGFINLIIDQGLTRGCTLGGASESFSTQEKGSERIPSTSNTSSIKESINKNSSSNKGGVGGKKKDLFAVKHLPDSIQVPDAIVDCDQLLREYWSVKRGTRSERVWSRLCGKLATWTPADRRSALEAAIASGWADVYEPKPDRSAAKPTSTLDYEAMDKIKMPW